MSDTLNFLGSPGIVEYATARGWYDPSKDGEFHFARAFSNPGSLNHPGNVHRMWRGVNLASGREYGLEDDFPFAFKPNNKISLQQVMTILRDHYEGTRLDKSKNYNLGTPYQYNSATICSQGTQYSMVAQLRGWMPSDMGTVAWITTFRPDAQAYVPWYICVDETPAEFRHTTYREAIHHQFDPPDVVYDSTQNHIYWTCTSLAKIVDHAYASRITEVRTEWTPMETQCFSYQDKLERKALRIFRKNPAKARKWLGDYSIKMAMRTFNKAGEIEKRFVGVK
jgi:dipeptidase